MKWDVADPVHRAVLMTARSWGVSPSRFIGEEPVTVYTRTTSGQLVSSRPGPEWSDDDRDAALGLAEYEASLCPGCSAPLAETTDPANENRYKTTAMLCHRCVASDIASTAYQAHPHPNALMISTELPSA
jgi:hypothetical protein